MSDRLEVVGQYIPQPFYRIEREDQPQRWIIMSGMFFDQKTAGSAAQVLANDTRKIHRVVEYL